MKFYGSRKALTSASHLSHRNFLGNSKGKGVLKDKDFKGMYEVKLKFPVW